MPIIELNNNIIKPYEWSWGFADAYSPPVSCLMSVKGEKLYELIHNAIHQYTFSIPWDLSTLTYDGISYSTSLSDIQDLYFKPDGTTAFVPTNMGNTCLVISFSLAWDLSTATPSSTEGNALSDGIFFHPEGTYFYSLGTYTNTIKQYTLSSNWDLSTKGTEDYTYSSPNGGNIGGCLHYE